MPLGEIKPRELTAREKFVATLAYPKDKDVIWHLTRNDFRAYLIGMDPRNALILTCDPDGHGLVHYQQTKRWYHEVRDWAWRVRHGNR